MPEDEIAKCVCLCEIFMMYHLCAIKNVNIKSLNVWLIQGLGVCSLFLKF